MSTPRIARWLPWALGVATLAGLVLVVAHFAEERAFLLLLQHSQPAWLLWALALQSLTYVAQAQVWRAVLRRVGQLVPFGLTCRLSLAKLFVDQALPSLGVSGSIVVAQTLERRGVPRAAVMTAVAVDSASYFVGYAVNLALAMVLLAAEGEARPLLVAAGVVFTVCWGALAATVLGLGGRVPGRWMQRVVRMPGVGRIVDVLAQASREVLHDPRVILRTTLLQLLITASDAATLWTLLRAVGTEASPAAVYASFVVASVLRSVGLLPGGLGTFEAGSVGALTLAGVPVAAALSATLMFRVLSFWLPMIPGLLLTRGLGPRQGTQSHGVRAPSNLS